MSATTAWVAAATIAAVILTGWPALLLRGDSRDRARPSRTRLSSERLRAWTRGTPGAESLATAHWCDAAARALRAGATLSTAVAEACDSNEAAQRSVGPLLTTIARGQPVASAAATRAELLADQRPGDPFVLAVAVVASCAELGGPAAAPLERTASTLRMRAALAEEQHAQSAQARLSAQVLTVVPLGLLGLLALTAPDVRAVLPSPAGITVIGIGMMLNVVGWWWMQRIVKSAVPR